MISIKPFPAALAACALCVGAAALNALYPGDRASAEADVASALAGVPAGLLVDRLGAPRVMRLGLGGMVLAWSQDRVGPVCRTAEDCAMVFNVLHGVDEKDPSTVTTPFQFDRGVKLGALRIGVDMTLTSEVCAAADMVNEKYRKSR